MPTPHITIIGSGNMGSALIRGLLAQGHALAKLCATDPSAEKLAELKSHFPIELSQDNKAAIKNCDILILAVKPQILPQVATEIAAAIQAQQPLVISIAAGIPLKRLEEYLGSDCALVRCMPNTPALIGEGASALYANAKTSPQQRASAEEILSCVGSTVWLEDEKQMDIVTALSGSGPAYFFLMMEALTEAAKQAGLPEKTARDLCLQTALGSAELAQQSSHSLAELRQQVTSPGGTTEAALKVLEKLDLRGLMKQALMAAEQRSKELGST